MLDPVDPANFYPWFPGAVKELEEGGGLETFRGLDDHVGRVPIVDRPPYNHGLREPATSAPLKNACTHALFTAIAAGTPSEALIIGCPLFLAVGE